MTNATDKKFPAIEFQSVFLSFDDKPALVDISFQLGHGEMIFVTGVSGSGKSVLLRLAIGLLKPDAGRIFIEGREIQTLEESDLLAIRGGLMGMVFQEDSLFTGLTVYENAAYRLEEHGWTEEKIEKAVSEVLRFVGLQGEEDRFPEELSGGMKRRLEFARALIGWPSILLLDEPTISLDPIKASQVLTVIMRARDINKISSLYVTKKVYEIPYLSSYHALEPTGRSEHGSNRERMLEVGEIAITKAPLDQLPKTRALVLEKGRIVFIGSADEFENSNLPSIRRLITLDTHDHSKDPYFPDPWDKKRRPKEEIL